MHKLDYVIPQKSLREFKFFKRVDNQLDKQMMALAQSQKIDEKDKTINLNLSPMRSQSPLNQSQHTNSSGNLPTYPVQLERSPESVKHLGDYLPSSPSYMRPPRQKKTVVLGKDMERDKQKKRN